MNNPGESKAWFAPKRHGYGAGLPIAWQGWAALVLYGAAVGLAAWLRHVPGGAARGSSAVLFMIATAVLLVVTARKTRGGWKWRWGSDD